MPFVKSPSPADVEAARPIALRFGASTARRVREGLEAWTACPATPLRPLPELARQLGISAVWAKDERDRMGLASFKALGGTWAVLQAARRPETTATFTAATAGNHGRAVARGAELIKAPCVIYVCADAPGHLVDAIRREGADVVIVSGDYEAALAECAAAAEKEGRILISDTADSQDDPAPGHVMEGYCVLADEMVAQAEAAPSHLFLQAGVGGMAAAVTANVRQAGWAESRVIVVEPAAAACVQAAAKAGTLVELPPDAPSNMGRLHCRRASALAVPLLRGLSNGFVEVSDDQAKEAADLLERSGLATSPSGAAGLAGLARAARDPDLRRAFDLSDQSRVVIVVTEAPAARPA